MTPQQRAAIFELFPGMVPPQQAVTQRSILAIFGTEDGADLALRLLNDAERERNPDDVEAALLVALTFGMDASLLPTLKRLAREPWHTRHQDISRYLVEIGPGDDVVDDLDFLAWAGAQYQDY